MKRVLLLRHGESDGNVSGIIQGQSHQGYLSERGRRQMELVATYLVGRALGPLILWHSPQRRVEESAELIEAAVNGTRRPAHGLKQRGWGEAEGKPRTGSGITGIDAFRGEPGQPLPPDAESLESVRTRLHSFSARLQDDPAVNHVVVSHDEILNYLANLWTDKWLTKRSVANGEIIEVLLDSAGRATERPISVFPPRLVAVVDAGAFLRMPEGKALLSDHDLHAMADTALSLAQHDDVVAAILGDGPFGEEEAARFPNLETVARFGTGLDAVRVAELKGIRVTRTRGVNARAVAEHILGATIVLLRNVPSHAAALRLVPHIWKLEAAPGLQLADTTVGIIGFGSIGIETARLFHAVGVGRILAYNRSWVKSATTSAAGDLNVIRSSTEDIYAAADVIVLSVALSDETRQMLDEPALNMIAAGGRRPVLVNTARGEVVDEAALLGALNRGTIRWAALDVWSAERDSTSAVVQALRAHPRVLATPHIAGYTDRAARAAVIRCATNVVAVIEGRRWEADELVEPPASE